VKARFGLLTSNVFYVPAGTIFKPLEFDREIWHVRMCGPVQSKYLAEGSPGVIPSDLASAATDPRVSERVKVNGAETLECDLLIVEVEAPSFDRSDEEAKKLLDVAISAANQWLIACRVLRGAHQVGPVTALGCSWRVDYLADDGKPLPPETGKVGHRRSVRMVLPAIPTLTDHEWEAMNAVGPDFAPPSLGRTPN
jgi:hypothetical protein